MMPPPMPKSALKAPATRPIATSRITRETEGGRGAPAYRRASMSTPRTPRGPLPAEGAVAAAAAELLEELASEPARAAVLLDVDGTLAPIVEVPMDARVPQETRAELQRLHGRFCSSPASAAGRA